MWGVIVVFHFVQDMTSSLSIKTNKETIHLPSHHFLSYLETTHSNLRSRSLTITFAGFANVGFIAAATAILFHHDKAVIHSCSDTSGVPMPVKLTDRPFA